MLSIKLSDGMGNQMFQYALYREKDKNGIKVFLDTSYFERKESKSFSLNVFKGVKFNELREKSLYYHERFIPKRIIRLLLKLVRYIYYEKINLGFDCHVMQKQNGILVGYFQNEMYFSSVYDELRNDFEFIIKDDSLKWYIKYLDMQQNTVSIHVRRGDYVQLSNLYGGICTPNYYVNAIARMNLMLDNPKYIVLSNDMEWAKENLRIPNANYILSKEFDGYEDWYDMCIMSHCKHNIIANSSFSWWGAWLNPNKSKIVMCPTKWDNVTGGRKVKCRDWIEIQS